MHLEDVLAHDMKVVEQPVSRGSDVDGVDSLARDRGESSMCVLENAASFGEPREQPGTTARRRRYALAASQGGDALAELLGTQ
jgi:hypothetical protein